MNCIDSYNLIKISCNCRLAKRRFGAKSVSCWCDVTVKWKHSVKSKQKAKCELGMSKILAKWWILAPLPFVHHPKRPAIIGFRRKMLYRRPGSCVVDEKTQSMSLQPKCARAILEKKTLSGISEVNWWALSLGTAWNPTQLHPCS